MFHFFTYTCMNQSTIQTVQEDWAENWRSRKLHAHLRWRSTMTLIWKSGLQAFTSCWKDPGSQGDWIFEVKITQRGATQLLLLCLRHSQQWLHHQVLNPSLRRLEPYLVNRSICGQTHKTLASPWGRPPEPNRLFFNIVQTRRGGGQTHVQKLLLQILYYSAWKKIWENKKEKKSFFWRYVRVRAKVTLFSFSYAIACMLLQIFVCCKDIDVKVESGSKPNKNILFKTWDGKIKVWTVASRRWSIGARSSHIKTLVLPPELQNVKCFTRTEQNFKP